MRRNQKVKPPSSASKREKEGDILKEPFLTFSNEVSGRTRTRDVERELPGRVGIRNFHRGKSCDAQIRPNRRLITPTLFLSLFLFYTPTHRYTHVRTHTHENSFPSPMSFLFSLVVFLGQAFSPGLREARPRMFLHPPYPYARAEQTYTESSVPKGVIREAFSRYANIFASLDNVSTVGFLLVSSVQEATIYVTVDLAMSTILYLTVCGLPQLVWLTGCPGGFGFVDTTRARDRWWARNVRCLE